LLGNGDGTFQNVVGYGTGTYGNSIVVTDANQDGNLDLVVTSNGGGGVLSAGINILLGNGDGTFQGGGSSASGGWWANAVATADVNGDGKPDFVVANCSSAVNCSGDIGVVGVIINTSNPASTTVLSSTPNPSNFAQVATFTATVTGPGGTPAGTVSFYNGTTSIGNSNLNSGAVATLTTSALPVGTDAITATYSGDTDLAPSTSHVLNQVVQGAVVSFSAASMFFGAMNVGIGSSPQPVMLTNAGNISLTITSIGITGANASGFSQTNNCPSSLSPNNSCNISVIFTPVALGSASASVSVTDSAPGSPQSIALTGVGGGVAAPAIGLMVASGSGSATVPAGTTATYLLSIGGAGWSGSATLTCTGAPTGAVCSIPSIETVSATSAANVVVNVTTTTRTSALLVPAGRGPSGWLLAMVVLGLAVASTTRHVSRNIRRIARSGLCLGLLLILVLPGCGGSSGGSSTPPPNSNGTPAGTYSLSVTAAGSGIATQNVVLTLIVQ
jgi:hypothetical protein